jgi:hypothetical protein
MQQDFLDQKGEMQELVESKGHLILFYPKFHCELNWIEYYWGAGKRFCRDNCEYSFAALQQTISDAFDSIKPTTIAAFFARCQRRIDAYRQGFEYGTEEFQTYTSHRRIRGEAERDR